MILMYLLMILPLPAVLVFFFLPIDVAVPVYIVCLLLSGAMHWLMRKSMKIRIVTGAEELVGKDAKVISATKSAGSAPYLVRIKGETWSAFSPDEIGRGDMVTVTAVTGNMLKVKCKSDS